jgi:hypothetical protein
MLTEMYTNLPTMPSFMFLTTLPTSHPRRVRRNALSAPGSHLGDEDAAHAPPVSDADDADGLARAPSYDPDFLLPSSEFDNAILTTNAILRSAIRFDDQEMEDLEGDNESCVFEDIGWILHERLDFGEDEEDVSMRADDFPTRTASLNLLSVTQPVPETLDDPSEPLPRQRNEFTMSEFKVTIAAFVKKHNVGRELWDDLVNVLKIVGVVPLEIMSLASPGDTVRKKFGSQLPLLLMRKATLQLGLAML